MDPTFFSLPEIDLSDRLTVMSQVAQVHVSDLPVVPVDLVPQKHPIVAEILQERENPDPDMQPQMNSNHQHMQHLTPRFNPMQPQQAQDDPSYINILPQPGFIPELIITPCSPPDVCWTHSNFFRGPSVLVPIISPPELRGPGLPRHSWLLMPEGHPVWCLCPQEVPVDQPCSADMERTAQQVSDQLNATPESAVSGKMLVKSEAEQQQNQNITPVESPGTSHVLDEQLLEEQSIEEFIDSFCTQERNEEEENLGMEYSSFLDFLDELCRDENLVREVDFTPDAESLDSPPPSDPEPIDLLALVKQEQEVTSTLKTENVNPATSSDPDPTDFSSQLVQEICNEILEKLPDLCQGDSNSVGPVTEDKYSCFEETSPLQAFWPLPCSQSYINPNHGGETPTQWIIEQNEVLPTLSPLVPSHFLSNSSFLDYLDELCTDDKFVQEVEFTLDTEFLDSLLSSDPDPIDLLAKQEREVDNPNHNGANSLQRNVDPKEDLTPIIASHLLEARDDGALVEEHAAKWYESIEDAMFLLNLADPESARFQFLAPESPSTSSFSGSNDDPSTIPSKESTASFRDPLLTFIPPAQHQIRESQEQCSTKTKDSKSPCPEAVPVTDTLSFVSDSQAVNVNLSHSVPKEQTEPPVLEVSEDLASPEIRKENQEETERQEKDKATKSTEERKEENQRSKTKLKVVTNTRRIQRLTGQIEKEKPRHSKGGAVERKPVGKSGKKTAKFTPEMQRLVYEKKKRRLFVGRQLFKQEESHFEKLSQATERQNTETDSEIGEKEQLKLNMEGGEPHRVDNPDMTTETGAENALLDTMPQAKKIISNETKEEEIQMFTFVKRQSRSITTEEKVLLTPPSATTARRKVKNPEMERNQMKSSPTTDVDNLKVNVKKEAAEPKTLLVSSPLKRSRTDEEEESRTNEDKVSLPELSLQSPKVQTDTHSLQDLIKVDQSRQELPKEGLLSETTDAPSEKTCQENRNVTTPEAQQQSRTADRQSDVTNLDFYSLRSKMVAERTVNTTGIKKHKPTNQSANLKLTADVKGEDDRINGEEEEYPMKRQRHEQGEREAVKETDDVGIETEISSSSPKKRGRWKSRGKADTDREERRLTANEKVKEGTRDRSGDEPSLPLTRSSTKKDGEMSVGHETFKGDSGSQIETSTSRTKASSFPPTRRLFKRLTTKYKDFILCRTNTRSRRLQLRSGRRIGS